MYKGMKCHTIQNTVIKYEYYDESLDKITQLDCDAVEIVLPTLVEFVQEIFKLTREIYEWEVNGVLFEDKLVSRAVMRAQTPEEAQENFENYYKEYEMYKPAKIMPTNIKTKATYTILRDDMKYEEFEQRWWEYNADTEKVPEWTHYYRIGNQEFILWEYYKYGWILFQLGNHKIKLGEGLNFADKYFATLI